MKAAVLTGIRALEVRELPPPSAPGDTDVLVRIHTVGVCGSDVHYYTTGRIGDMVVSYPFIVGHECSGVVEQVGASVNRCTGGDRVAVDPAMSCWRCDQCRAGRHHTCRSLRFLGCPGQAPGCLCEHIVVPQESCFPVGERMSFDEAALSEPLAIGLYGVRKSVPMKGSSIAILGAGPIGLSVLHCARALGAREVFMTDRITERIACAHASGATWTAHADADDVVATGQAHVPQGFDAVFECCGQQEAVDQALDLIRPGGKLMLIGIPETDRLSFVMDSMRRREVCVQNVRRQVGCVEDTLRMIEDRAVNLDKMVTHRFALDDTQAALDLVADYRDGVVKAMVMVGE